MVAACASCMTETDAGLRCSPGILCPACALARQKLAMKPLSTLKTIDRLRQENAEDYLARKELTSMVQGREEFHRKLGAIEEQISWLQFQAGAVAVAATVVTLYIRFKGLRFLAYIAAGTGVWCLGALLVQLVRGISNRRKVQLEELSKEGAYRRYTQLQADLGHLDQSKQRLVRKQILPKLKALMEEKLPYLMQRRFEFGSFLRSYRLPDLTAEVDELQRKLQEIEDPELKEALSKRHRLTETRRQHYLELERRMHLYQIHLGNLESHMENLLARIVMLDPNDDFRRATENIMQGLDEEVEILEEAYQETLAAP